MVIRKLLPQGSLAAADCSGDGPLGAHIPEAS